MQRLLKSFGLKQLYSNIKISTDPNRQVAFLTLCQEKKRNPLTLATVQEMYAGLEEIEQKIQTERLKV